MDQHSTHITFTRGSNPIGRSRSAFNGVKKQFLTAEEAIKAARRGEMLLIADDPKRENEADLYIPADATMPAHVETMIRDGGGILCVAMTSEYAARLELPLMVPQSANTESTGVSFTISVNARHGISTGVSPHDRAKTIRLLANPKTRAENLTRPGHVLGLVARGGGLRERRGHTEAAVDLARLSGRAPLGVLCEVVGENGHMARGKEILVLAKKLGIGIVSVQSLVRYVRTHPLPATSSQFVTRVSEAKLPMPFGNFRVRAYRSIDDGREHAALVLGQPKKNALVRVHSQCATGDIFHSLRCDCGKQLDESFRRIAHERSGVILYLSQEGRGIGLGNKIKAYALQDKGMDTVQANHALGFRDDARTYEVAASMLRDIGLSHIRLLTNNPRKVRELRGHGLRVGRIALETVPNAHNIAYMRTKKRKLGHLLSL